MISKAHLFINTSFLLAILLMIASSLSAQPDNSRQIDSLKALFPKQEGVEKIESLFELAQLVSNSNLDSAIYYHSLALETAIDIQNNLWHIRVLRNLSTMYSGKLEYSIAKSLLDKALFLCEKGNEKRQLSYVFTEIGNHFMDINLYDSALLYFYKSLNVEEELGNQNEHFASTSIGIIYYKIGNHNLSLKYFNKALNSMVLSGETMHIFSMYVNIGLVYIALGNLDDAKRNFENAIQINEKHKSIYIANAYEGMGRVFALLNNIDSAYYYLFEAIKMGNELNDARAVAYCYSHLAKLELEKNSYQTSLDYLGKSQALFPIVGDKILSVANYNLYAKLYEALNQLDSAYQYQKKYLALKDSIFHNGLSNNLTHLQLAYQAEESQKVIEEKEQQLTQTTKYLWLAGMVLLICVVQLFRFYHRFL